MKLRTLRFLIVAWLAPAGIFTGCNKACTEIGCYDGLAFEFASPLEVRGEITVVISGDDERRCTQLISSDVGPCYDSGITFERSPQGSFSGVKINGVHPKQVSLEISADGAVQLQGSGAPVYQDLQPNGDGCPPTCRLGRMVVP